MPLNLNQGSKVATIQAKLWMKDVGVGIVTRTGATTGDDGPWLQVHFDGKNKVTFDIVIDKDTFFEAKHAIERNLGKSPVFEMSSAFDPSIEEGPS